jgi:hypothetical protein
LLERILEAIRSCAKMAERAPHQIVAVIEHATQAQRLQSMSLSRTGLAAAMPAQAPKLLP